MYKALIEIGGYKPGEEVPEREALIWKDMYKVSPVEKVGEEDSKESEEDGSVENVESAEKNEDSEPEGPKDSEPDNSGETDSKEESTDFLLEDYLGRNQGVVKKNIERDNKLTKDQLEKLKDLEKSGNNRPGVIKAIERKLEAMN